MYYVIFNHSKLTHAYRKHFFHTLLCFVFRLRRKCWLSDRLHTLCFPCSAGLERDKFDNKTVSFEEHIKSEHNMWHYLYFLVLVKVKDPTEYTGPESYVAQMIVVSDQRV